MYLTFVIALIILALILPFLLTDAANIKLRVGANLLSGIGSCLTLIIAILLYNKYGINKSIVDKKREAVLNILEGIKSLTITIKFNRTTLFYKPGDQFYKHNEEFYGINLLISTSYYDGLEKIFNHVNNLYTPKELILCIEKLNPSIITPVKDNVEDYGKVTIQGTIEGDNWFGELNSKPLSFLDFTTYWDEIISAAQSWLKNNSGEQIELNIE